MRNLGLQNDHMHLIVDISETCLTMHEYSITLCVLNKTLVGIIILSLANNDRVFSIQQVSHIQLTGQKTPSKHTDTQIHFHPVQVSMQTIIVITISCIYRDCVHRYCIT